ncbi:MAG: hypothetical protein WA867_20455, partial [Candidatus Acidiferrales bacterium]
MALGHARWVGVEDDRRNAGLMQMKKSGRRGEFCELPGRWKKRGDYFFLSGMTLSNDLFLRKLLDFFLAAMCF